MNLLLFALLLAPQGVRVDGHFHASRLEVGSEHEVQLRVNLDDGVAADQAGMPGFILQLDVPDCLELLEPDRTSFQEQARNELLAEPYERILKPGGIKIPVRLLREPEQGESLGAVLIGYLSGPDGQDPTFFRRRYEFPIGAGTSVRSGEKENSHWGKDGALLQIGDRVEPVVLPTLDGGEVDLGEVLGEKNLIVTTYRAFW